MSTDIKPEVIFEELFNLIVGTKLGSGMYRTVFSSVLSKDVVFKFQDNHYCFDNVSEWLAWQEYKEVPEVAKWLAPCHYISPNGNILIQERTKPVFYDLPKEMPAFLCDTKPKNYGMLGKGKNKRFVCHDYGYLVNAKLSTKLKKTEWWETETKYKV